MKRILLTAALSLAAASAAIPAEPTPPANEQALLLLIKEVQAQQSALAENQAKIDQRLAAIAEAVRLARIYSSRSGN